LALNNHIEDAIADVLQYCFTEMKDQGKLARKEREDILQLRVFLCAPAVRLVEQRIAGVENGHRAGVVDVADVVKEIREPYIALAVGVELVAAAVDAQGSRAELPRALPGGC
jgi:hypothetical protein